MPPSTSLLSRALLAALAGLMLAVLLAAAAERPAQGGWVALAVGAYIYIHPGAGAGARPALTQKLEDVFSAPLDALANYVRGIDQTAAGPLYAKAMPDVAMRPTAVAPGTTLALTTANGPMDVTVDSLPGQDGRIQVHGTKGGQLYSGQVMMKSTYGGPDSPLGQVSGRVLQSPLPCHASLHHCP